MECLLLWWPNSVIMNVLYSSITEADFMPCFYCQLKTNRGKTRSTKHSLTHTTTASFIGDMTYSLIKINLHGGSSAVIVWFLTSLSVLVSSEMKDEWFIVGNGSDAETSTSVSSVIIVHKL